MIDILHFDIFYLVEYEMLSSEFTVTMQLRNASFFYNTYDVIRTFTIMKWRSPINFS